MSIYSKTDEVILAGIGSRLRAARLAENLTQQALAERSGVSLNTVRNAEDGQNVSLETLIRLMRALQILPQIDVLLADRGPSPVDLARRDGKQRQRASGQSDPETGDDWSW